MPYPTPCAAEAKEDLTQYLKGIEDRVEIRKVDSPDLSFSLFKDPSQGNIKDIGPRGPKANGTFSPARKLPNTRPWVLNGSTSGNLTRIGTLSERKLG